MSYVSPEQTKQDRFSKTVEVAADKGQWTKKVTNVTEGKWKEVRNLYKYVSLSYISEPDCFNESEPFVYNPAWLLSSVLNHITNLILVHT